MFFSVSFELCWHIFPLDVKKSLLRKDISSPSDWPCGGSACVNRAAKGLLFGRRSLARSGKKAGLWQEVDEEEKKVLSHHPPSLLPCQHQHQQNFGTFVKDGSVSWDEGLDKDNTDAINTQLGYYTPNLQKSAKYSLLWPWARIKWRTINFGGFPSYERNLLWLQNIFFIPIPGWFYPRLLFVGRV